MTPADVIEGRARWCVVEGDALDGVQTLPRCINAVVTDPPSGIAFMGAEWDRNKGGRAQWVAWLAAILAAARAACVDGARAAVWALPRTSHWTGCAVEDAGWAIETCGVHLFGSGWPKGKSQLKPAGEHWWFARTGSSLPLNVDACRVGTDWSTDPTRRGWQGRHAPNGGMFAIGVSSEVSQPHSAGRYPPNVLLSHTPECVLAGTRRVTSASTNAGRGACGIGATGLGAIVGNTGYADADGFETVDAWECVEGCAVRVLGEQSGESSAPSKITRGAGGQHGAYGAIGEQRDVPCYGDTGTAARFYPQFQHGADEMPFLYCAKPSRAEKEAGCETLPQVTQERYGEMGQGPLPQQTPRVATPRGNPHPTVKPVDLMRWLIRLTTQPGDIVLDPFGGSGTTGVAALREGRRVILCEREADFAAVIRARLEHAAPSPERLRVMTTEPVRVAASRDDGPLFGGAR